ncbi:MAG: hypothetical protein A3I05_04045 [Deltaproteobacteria bacterium RIFCSPLOWO2_02_FULL_44_10]|nr:MAG: hypothetical protein A3C46_03805 [Deltaproteobacteria bacterium RIFCSPHIGHO2_02_FULL_44_16]OGQ46318.1 MAG: hypothetical protein A3I05_04045 [Deltaproteobacteria bacterium RIFCSPLOWO2_02_FULL_44_10]
MKRWNVGVITEVMGSTRFEKFFNDQETTPLDVNLLLRKSFLKNRRLIAQVGAGRGLTDG